MRLLLVSTALFSAWLVAFVPAQAQQPQSSDKAKEKARIEGTVLSSDGAPIPRATIRLQPSAPVLNAGTPVLPATATAGQDGTYAIENIEPGTYTLTAQRPGFVNTVYGQRRPNTPGTPIELRAGQTQSKLDITMIPQGVIAGKVTDQNGDLLQGVQVMALRQGYQRGVKTLMTAASASTNDLGEYRIANLMPGQYFVAAADRRAIVLLTAQGNITAAGTGREGNVTTYYPNATDPRAAAPVSINAGAELRGTDIRMRTGKMFSISGKAVGPGGAAVANALLSMTPREAATGDALASALSRSTSQVRPDGSFSFNNVAPGQYVLMALTSVQLNGQATPNLTGRADVTVSDADIKDVVFPLSPGASVTGTVTLDGGVPIQKLFEGGTTGAGNVAPQTVIAATNAGVTIAGMTPTVGLTETVALGARVPSARVAQDGSFKMEGIGPSRFGVTVAGLPQGWYLKAARFGGADVLKTGIDFSTGGGGGEMAIVLGNKPASVTGVVRNSRGDAEQGLVVALWTAEADFGSTNNGVRTAYTNQNGTFNFANLPPGEYFVAAFEDAEPGQMMNRDLLKMVTGDAEELKLDESGAAANELKPVSAEALAQYMAKLP